MPTGSVSKARVVVGCVGGLILLLLLAFGFRGQQRVHLSLPSALRPDSPSIDESVKNATLTHAVQPDPTSDILRLDHSNSEGSLEHIHSEGSLEHINNATLGFQKIFVISMPSQTDHRDAAILAAALSGLQIEMIDGVDGTKVPDHALPPDFADKEPGPKVRGSWRAHMNAIQEVVRQNLSSALILEDDVDWDIRVKSQFQDFARSIRLLVQPTMGEFGEQFLDPTFPRSSEGQVHHDIDVREHQNMIKTPTTSPYGDIDRWDLLWPGHCGANFPEGKDRTPLGRAILHDDETAAETQHFDPQWGDKEVIYTYPNHTRITYRAKECVCNLAYALTRNGARRLLYELGVHTNTYATDISIRDYCDGTNGRPGRVCLTVQPPLMMHHNPVRKDGTGESISHNIRWAVKVNFPVLIEDRPESEYIDRFPNAELTF